MLHQLTLLKIFFQRSSSLILHFFFAWAAGGSWSLGGTWAGLGENKFFFTTLQSTYLEEITGVFGFIGLEIECGADPAPVGVVTGGTVELFLDDAEDDEDEKKTQINVLL